MKKKYFKVVLDTKLAKNLGAQEIKLPKTIQIATVHGKSLTDKVYRVVMEIDGKKRSIDLVALEGLTRYYPEYQYRDIPQELKNKFNERTDQIYVILYTYIYLGILCYNIIINHIFFIY